MLLTHAKNQTTTHWIYTCPLFLKINQMKRSEFLRFETEIHTPKNSHIMKNFFTLLALTVLVLSGNYAQTTQTFNSTVSMQSFIVPACVNSISIDANGAQGGFGTPMFGGLGARIIGTFAVNPGDSIVILVGGQGQSSSNSGGGGRRASRRTAWPS